MTYHGGATIDSANVYNLYWDPSWDADHPSMTSAAIDGTTSSMINGGFFACSGQYFNQGGTFVGSKLSGGPWCPSSPPPAGLTYTDVGVWAVCEVGGPLLGVASPTGVPQPDDNSIYSIHVPAASNYYKNAPLCAGPDQDLAAHLAAFVPKWYNDGYVWILNPAQRFAVIADFTQCAVGSLDNETVNHSHEIIEAATDPATLGWYDGGRGSSAGEVGDLCNFTTAFLTLNNVKVQSYWDQSVSHACCTFDGFVDNRTIQLSMLGLDGPLPIVPNALVSPNVFRGGPPSVSVPLAPVFKRVVRAGTSFSYEFLLSSYQPMSPPSFLGTEQYLLQNAPGTHTVTVLADFTDQATYGHQFFLGSDISPKSLQPPHGAITASGWHDAHQTITLKAPIGIWSQDGSCYFFQWWVVSDSQGANQTSYNREFSFTMERANKAVAFYAVAADPASCANVGASQPAPLHPMGVDPPQDCPSCTSFNAPGNILITDQLGSRVFEVDSRGQVAWQLGFGPQDQGPTSVYGVRHAARHGAATLLAIAGDGAGAAGAALDSRVIDVDSSGNVLFQYGQRGVSGSAAGQLATPTHVAAIDPNGVLITDQVNHRVILVDRVTQMITWQFGITGVPGISYNQLNLPSSAEPSSLPGNMIIADTGNHRVIEATPWGSVARVWTGGWTLMAPASAQLLSNGNVLVADPVGGRVMELGGWSDSVIWQYSTYSGCTSGGGATACPGPTYASRLPNGHTLVTIKDANEIRVVDASGAIVAVSGGAPPGGAGGPDLHAPSSAAPIVASSSSGGLSPLAACMAAASAYCARFITCNGVPGYLLWQSSDHCSAVTAANCADNYGASPPSFADATQCVSDLAATGCDSLALGSLPPACQRILGGHIAVGQACYMNAQCDSAFCDRSTASSPTSAGSCGNLPTLGSACTYASGTARTACGPARVCAPAGICVTYGGLNAPCSGDLPCAPSFSCVGYQLLPSPAGTSSAMGACQLPLSAGAPCDPMGVSTAACSRNMGLTCDPFSHVCVYVQVAALGAPCGRINGQIVLCGGSAFCPAQVGAAAAVCVAAVPNGGACAPDGTPCAPPASCMRGACRVSPPLSPGSGG